MARPWRRFQQMPYHHQFVDDGLADHRGETRCLDCGLPKSNRAHQLPRRDDDERDAEQRRMGEEAD